jgi:hypothetical protein
MKTYLFRGVLTALSSISHNGGQSFGITSKLRREKFVQPDYSVEEIPVISGNALRGLLRDRGMLHMCKQLGYGVNEKTGDVDGLTLAAFYFLFSGGALTSTGDGAINIEEARRIRTLIPLVGVFGGAVGNQILPGKLKMGKAIPIVAETTHLLPEAFRPEKPQTIWDYLQEEMYTRKDDEKNEHLRTMIAPAVRGLLDGATPKLAKTEAQNEQHQQMMYYVETFAAGTPFYWQITLDDVTDVEFEAFLTALAQFSRMPYVGGKSNVGHGEVSVRFDKWLQIDSRLDTNGTEISLPIGTMYQQHLQGRADEIRDLLARMK